MTELPTSPSSALLAAILLIAAVTFPGSDSADAAAAACDAATISALQSSPAPVTIGCSVILPPDAILHAPIVLAGSSASQTLIDCHGGKIESAAADQVAVTIASVRRSDDQWDVPKNIVIRHCAIDGAIRVVGMGANGEADAVRQSSLSAGHTERAQAAAPSNILLSDLKITTRDAIPLYAGPGTTKLTVTKSSFLGGSGSVAIYLDAESAENTISDNRFDLATKSREIIAVDGSAHNVISGNTFDRPAHGGIFLYRNCGEGGTIRHQPSQHNLISDNVFVYPDRGWTSWWTTRPAIWLGSRQGDRSYCFHDMAHPFGSSLSSRDEARFNIVRDNRLEGGSPSLIVDNDTDNQIVGNH